MSGTNASLKRKREVDEDVDLYGETGTTEKKLRGSHLDDFPNNENIMECERQTWEATPNTGELVWLLFLVSQEGELQVHASFNGIDDRFFD